jgi:archaellum biogenesis protein FlaJ (TadC family)
MGGLAAAAAEGILKKTDPPGSPRTMRPQGRMTDHGADSTARNRGNHMITTIVLLIAVALIAVAAVPLLLRLIPQNPVYGVPTERTLDDEKLWFTVNAFAGKAVLIACGVVALLLILYQGTWLRSAWAQVAVFVIPLAIAVGATIAYERRLTR